MIYFTRATRYLPSHVTFMNLHPYGRLSSARLATFEAGLTFPLPKDYRDFLLQSNGGKFQGAVVPIPGLSQNVALDVFLGLDLESGLDLEECNRANAREIPQGCLVIGTDPGGGCVLLSTNPEWTGIYYWDKSFWFEESSADANIHPLAITFSTLMSMVK